MTELSRSLIAAAREGLAPDPDVAARVRAKVAAAVAASTAVATGSHAVAATAAPAPAPVAAPASPVAAAGSSSLVVKLGAALVVLGVVSSGVALVVRDAHRAPEVPQLEVASGDVEDVPAGVRVAVPNDPLVVPDAPRPRAKAPEPAPTPMPATAVPPTVVEPPTAAPEPATLSREVELIDLAMVSLRKNAPLAAIEAIRVFERETLGKGQMAEEAAAIELEARCKLREDVTAALARFDRKWPDSAQRERIQTACFARE